MIFKESLKVIKCELVYAALTFCFKPEALSAFMAGLDESCFLSVERSEFSASLPVVRDTRGEEVGSVDVVAALRKSTVSFLTAPLARLKSASAISRSSSCLARARA